MLSRAEVQGFYDIYLEKVGKKQAASWQPWLVPMPAHLAPDHAFHGTMAGCRHAVRAIRRTPHNGGDAGLDPAMKAHIDARIDYGFRRDAIAAIRSEWMA